MSFTSTPGTYFWSNGSAWGTCKVEAGKAKLEVLHGNLDLAHFSLGGSPAKLSKALSLKEGDSIQLKIN